MGVANPPKKTIYSGVSLSLVYTRGYSAGMNQNKSEQINLRLSASERENAEKVAESKGKSLSAVIRENLEKEGKKLGA